MTILVLCKLVNWQIDSGCSDGLCISVVLMHLCGAKRASAWLNTCMIIVIQSLMQLAVEPSNILLRALVPWAHSSIRQRHAFSIVGNGLPLESRLLPKGSAPIFHKLLKSNFYWRGWPGSASDPIDHELPGFLEGALY